MVGLSPRRHGGFHSEETTGQKMGKEPGSLEG